MAAKIKSLGKNIGTGTANEYCGSALGFIADPGPAFKIGNRIGKTHRYP
jgi:hypothetical protein